VAGLFLVQVVIWAKKIIRFFGVKEKIEEEYL
jgi:hypothetical protein